MFLFIGAQTWRDLVAMEIKENKIQQSDDVIHKTVTVLTFPQFSLGNIINKVNRVI